MAMRRVNHDKYGRAKRQAIESYNEASGLNEMLDKFKKRIGMDTENDTPNGATHTGANVDDAPDAPDTPEVRPEDDPNYSEPESNNEVEPTSEDFARATMVLRSSAPDVPGVMAIADTIEKRGNDVREKENEENVANNSDSDSDSDSSSSRSEN